VLETEKVCKSGLKTEKMQKYARGPSLNDVTALGGGGVKSLATTAM
jgi:hypothetical protein